MILVVVRYWPARSETFVRNEVVALRRRGVAVQVLALGQRDDADGLDPLGAWVLPRGLDGLRLAAHLRGVGSGSAKQRARKAWVVAKAREAGVSRVHAHFAGEAAEWAADIAAALQVPYSVTVHAADLFCPRPSLGSVLQGARPVITVCEHHRAHLLREYGVEATVVRCGVEPGRFRPPPTGPATLAKRDPPERALRLICVARYVPKKGIDALIAAVQRCEEPVHLRLVSDVSVRDHRIETGAAPWSAIPGLLRAADVAVLPCRVAPSGDRDGVPVFLMEAMASGLPVISTRVSGVPELVDDTVGWLVAPDAPDPLDAAIAASRSAVERQRRGRAARARIEAEWTLRQQVDGVLAAWGRA